MKKILILALLLPLAVKSQKLENLKAFAEGDKVIITYDLVNVPQGTVYDVALYASHNNYNTALQLVNGDVGENITEGNSKRIVWKAKDELGDYRGELSFEVRANEYVALALTNSFSNPRRGKTMDLSWKGGNTIEDVKIELLKAGVATKVLHEGPNAGSFQWTTSAEKAGSDYQIRLVNGNQAVVSKPFTIKHKIPAIVLVVPLAVAAYLLTPQSQSGGSDRPVNAKTVSTLSTTGG